MPELPEVETVRRGLQPIVEDARIVEVEQNRRDLRFPFPENFADRLRGRRVVALARRAKYLLAHLDDDNILVSHLGMSGSFRTETGAVNSTPGNFTIQRSKRSKHDHVVIHLRSQDGSAATVIYNDPRRFGFMLLINGRELAEHPMFINLGVEPTGNALDGDKIAELFRGKKSPLKAALLDQKLIAGLGNIYVCEALWRCGLDPRKVAGSIAKPSKTNRSLCNDLAAAVREVIADAIEAGGSSLRDYVHTDGSLGYFQHSFSVYDREGEVCQRDGCNGIIGRLVQSGRSTFYCPSCQH